MSHSLKSSADLEHELLSRLAVPGAFARIDGKVALVFAPRKGITVRTGVGDASALQALVSAGAVRQLHGRRAVSFVIDEAGAARLRRQSLPQSGRFQQQHGAIEIVAAEGDAPAHAINLRESPLLWLHRRSGKGRNRAGGRLIGDAEFAAGERLRNDMTMARTLPSLSADLERPSRSGVAIGLMPSEARLAAGQRVQAALRAVGPELSGVLVDVCGVLKGLDVIERERNWPARSAKLVLCLGLAALARHYGLSNAAVGSGNRTRAWADAGSRPDFTIPQPDAAAPPP